MYGFTLAISCCVKISNIPSKFVKYIDVPLFKAVTPFEPEVENFVNVVTIENEDKEDLKITVGLPVEIEKVLQHPTKWLDDRIINHAQELIKRKYKDTDGLQDPVLQRFATVDGTFVQVLHVNNNHWICVAGNKNNEISVYNSMGGNLSQDTVHVIARMVKCEDEEFMVKLMPVQHQTNGSDCGLFALAFATDFAEGIDPSERYYDEKALRNHQLQCFRNNEINQFPYKDISVKSKPSKIIYKVYDVFCICRDVFFEEDVEKEPENFIVQNVGNGIIVNVKSYPKKYSLNQMLRGNVVFAFDKCLFSTHFLFRKT